MGTKTWFKFFKDTISGESVQGILSDRKNGDKAVVLFIYLLERFCDKQLNYVELNLAQTARRLWTTSERIRNCLRLISEHIEDSSLEFVPGSFRFSLPNYLERQTYGDKRREDKEKIKSKNNIFENSGTTTPTELQDESAKADPFAAKENLPKRVKTKSRRSDPHEVIAENLELREYWLKTYELEKGFPYTIANHAKFATLIKLFRQTHGLERSKELVDLYLGWNRPLIAESGWDFSLLVKYVNGMLSEVHSPDAVIAARAKQNAAVQKQTRAVVHEQDMAEITAFAEQNPAKQIENGGPRA